LPQELVSIFTRGTLRWTCRSGDFVIWVRFTELSEDAELEILGLWQMKHGDYVTISNKKDDIPEWTKDLGFSPEYPNFWRVIPGDRVVWVGRSRPGLLAEGWVSEGGVLSLLDFRRHAIVMLDSKREDFDPLNIEEIKRQYCLKSFKYCQIALRTVRELGVPKVVEFDEFDSFE
jgi:hypothetical protein